MLGRPCRGAVVAALLASSATLGGLEPAPAVERACRGAEARDPSRTCDAEAVLRVSPTPAEARRRPNVPCTEVHRWPKVCAFGTSPSQARALFAVAGDSHAAHWRPALRVVAERRRWRGLSMTRLGCFVSAATKSIGEPKYSQCIAWKRALREYLRRRPAIATLVVSQLVGGSRIAGATDQFEAHVRGFMAAWQDLPRSVRHIIVIRDTPRAGPTTRACVLTAIVLRSPAGTACPMPLESALRPDPAVEAARRIDAPRVQVIDLTPLMCDAVHCFAVVGGTLVLKDRSHITRAFAETLAPYLDRELGRLAASWP